MGKQLMKTSLSNGLLCGLLLLGGCTLVGPDYLPPKSQTPADWQAPLAGGLTAGPAAAERLADWWQVFNDPLLASLIERAAERNLDLREARARLREARASRAISRAGLWPELVGNAAANRHRSSASTNSGATANYYAVGFDAGWELDLFGGTRRAVEAAQANLEAVTANLHDLQVSLAAEIALNYLDVRTFQARLAHATASIKNQQTSLELKNSLYASGLATELEVQETRQLLAELQVDLPDLETGLNAAGNRLTALLGEAPGALATELASRQPIPELPAELAVGIPADLLRRRPDIRQSERQLAAQTARIGVATAELYPRFSLSGLLGLEAVSSGDLLQSSSRVWQVGPSLGWNIFNAGSVRQNIEVQNARQQQALAAYEKTLLEALEEVENALFAYAREQTKYEALAMALTAAARREEITEDRYRSGLAAYKDVLEVKHARIQLQDALSRSSGVRSANLVRLYKALGGGWTPSAREPS